MTAAQSKDVSKQGLEELVGFESDAWLDRFNALAEIYYAIDEKCGEGSVVDEEPYKEIEADGVELTVTCNGKKYKVTVLYRYTAVVASVEEVSGNAR
jgi:2-keto-3-deoxy-6-phosphogluconate aldolase